MKKLLFLSLLGALVLSGAALADAGEWTGEVLDLQCYESRGAKGEGHASCAVRCLNGGSPMGLLVDGNVVYVDTENSDAAALKTMKDLGGKMVDIEGEAKTEGEKTTVKVTKAKASGK